MLPHIADSLERDTWRRLDLFVRLLEPLMLLLLAGVVLVGRDRPAGAGVEDEHDGVKIAYNGSSAGRNAGHMIRMDVQG